MSSMRHLSAWANNKVNQLSGGPDWFHRVLATTRGQYATRFEYADHIKWVWTR